MSEKKKPVKFCIACGTQAKSVFKRKCDQCSEGLQYCYVTRDKDGTVYAEVVKDK